MLFKKAANAQAFLKMGIQGFAGDGKTHCGVPRRCQGGGHHGREVIPKRTASPWRFVRAVASRSGRPRE